jgi:uncharacterized repeat protein (TIGR01451 family)
MWIISALPAGQTRQIDVECRCAKPVYKASNTVSVSTSEGAQAESPTYLEIRPAPGTQPPDNAKPSEATGGGPSLSGGVKPGENQPGENRPGGTTPQTTQPANALTMTVANLRNPVAAGKELTYEIRVVNNSNAVDRQVAVTAMIPDGMIPVPLGTTGPGQTKFVPDGRTIRFNPVMELQPGETLTYRVRVRSKSAGQFRFRAELTSQNITQPIQQEASTEVF